MKINSSQDLTNLQEEVGFAKDQFLRERGWKHTSANPGSQWLWERKLEDGRVALLNTESAIWMQDWFDMLSNPEPEESESNGS